jgi:hypothetical protein
MPMVVPWITRRVSASRAPAWSTQRRTPSRRDCGVLSAFVLSTDPVVSSSATRSVKVPPMSTPIRRATDRQYTASGAARGRRPTRSNAGEDYWTMTEVMAARQLLLSLDSDTAAVWSVQASKK